MTAEAVREEQEDVHNESVHSHHLASLSKNCRSFVFSGHSESGGQELASNACLIFRQMVHEANTSLKEKIQSTSQEGRSE